MRLAIPAELFAQMCGDVQQWFPLETGGILLGTVLSDEAEVVSLVGPGPRARHERFGMVPDWAWQRGEVARLYEQSGRVLEYLGDWHSHPRGSPKPSTFDVDAAGAIARSADARAPSPFMVILNTAARPQQVHATAYTYRDGALIRCRLEIVQR